MKRMLFNATQAEELRVAIVDGQKLIDLDIESAAKEQRKSNIYKGVITRIEPSLEAAFVNYGEERHGFLPFKEVSRSYFQPGVEAGRASIKEALREGQELIVQIEKDERGNKGAALTTFISLAGRYLVLMPNNPRGGGVSRRVEGEDRAELRELMDQLAVPQGMSLIARTAGIGRQLEELQWDLSYLMQLWTAIDGAAKSQSGPFLIYLEGSLVIRAIRDYFQPDIGEILIDTDDVCEQARAFMSTVMPANVNRVKRYSDDVPLFSRFQIEHQIETAFARQVNLPSGGAIVIDHTEALVSVDVNSGRSTRGQDIEETALKTNLEAADELARQLRLRDLGGLIVIDFIDMENARNQREVENRLRDALRYDRARVQMGKISRFGLMELSRQRLRPALAETSYIPCPRCNGTGHIRSTESSALHILRILEEEAMKDNTAAVHTQVPVDVATFLLNEKRADIAAIELRHKVSILLIPNIHFETPQHTIVRLRHDDLNQEDLQQPSYRMVEIPNDDEKLPSAQTEAKQPRQQAAIKNITPDLPAPLVQEKKAEPAAERSGFIGKILAWLGGNRHSEPTVETPARSENKPRRGREGQQRGERQGNRENREGREGRGGRGGRGGRRDEAENREARGERNDNAQRNVPTEQAPRDPAAAQPQREGRRNRGEKGEPRQERRERQAQGERTNDEALLEKKPQSGEKRSERNQERTAPAATDAAALAIVATDNTAVAGNEQPTTEEGTTRSRRGRRGGRRERGERRPESAESVVEGQENQASENASPVESTPAIAETVTAVSDTALEPVAVAESNEAPIESSTAVVEAAAPVVVEQPQAPETACVAVTAETVAAPVATEAAEPAPAVEEAVTFVAPQSAPAEHIAEEQAPATVAESTPMPVATATPLPAATAIVENLGQALESSGLVMVETSREKSQSWQPEVAEEVKPRPRRRRPAPVQSNEEPLVMVETRNII
jgi:ribonuclease E